MTQLGTYGFLPWLRNGIANTIASDDLNPRVKTRATVKVALRLSGEPVGGGAALTQDLSQDVALYGPGDLVGIDARAIVRTEPRQWNTNFESNYLAAIEFYDEDFLWRYTPAKADTADTAGGSSLRLRPWIALIVLLESEFKDGQNLQGRPAPYITVSDTSVFPPANELGSWAHVHFNQSLGADPTELISPDMSAVLPRVQAALSANRDVAYSRIVCPRRLAENTGYHAFVVPVFETGRLAGLGKSPDEAPHATFSAWDTYTGKTDPDSFPIYYRWYFRTGSVGDFEYLVRLLKPQPIDPKFGTRDVDVQYPGSGIPGITDKDLGGVLRLGGALRVPDNDMTPDQQADRNKYAGWDQHPYPHPFETALAAFINLSDDYASTDAAHANKASGLAAELSTNPDPLVTPPLYGRWHALTKRLLKNSGGTDVANNANWVHRLNLDPGYRVPAGFGADVIEQNAESYMNAAWAQIGDVLAANQRLRRLHFATAVSARWFDNHLKPLSSTNAERAFQIASPTAARIIASGQTLAYTQRASLLGPTLTSTAFRRVSRPGGRLMRALPFTATVTPANLLNRVNTGAVSAAPPITTPAGVATLTQAAAAVTGSSAVPAWVAALLSRFPNLPILVLIVAGVLALLLWFLVPVAGAVLAIAIGLGGFYLYRLLRRWSIAGTLVDALTPSLQTPALVDRLPTSPDFVLTQPGAATALSLGFRDSPTAVRFKAGLRESFALMRASTAVDAAPGRTALAMDSAATAAIGALDPRQTILKRGLSSMSIPAWIRDGLVDSSNEVMVYPRIDLPMYRPLKDRSIELLLPNINVIPPNSITLVETNQKFVEAYMVGLTHEFARKLFWREYPTDLRGSYFRQFWDPTPNLQDPTLDNTTAREQSYDIPPVDQWSADSALGTHSNHPPTSDSGEDAVLVIRGELLKKYPRAVIFAQKARWQTNVDGNPDLTLPRDLVDVPDTGTPSRDFVRTPLYEAKADPDIYFFGFDLTVAEARGGPGTSPTDDPGWFFVIKERPGEPRFGLELTRTGTAETFAELTWDDAMPGGKPGQHLPATALASVTLTAPSADPNATAQYADDQTINTASTSSARWAYLLMRSPSLVAVHATELLGSG